MEADRKAALRAATTAARRQLLPAEREHASFAAVTRLLTLPELRRAGDVLVFAATGDEIDVATLVTALRERGARILFPRVRGERLELAAADPGALRAGFRGILEPDGPGVDPAVVDVAVLPGVAFDLRGGRLGRGSGHYDRLLARVRAETLRVGVCFACQLVPSVPREPHDQAVDVVVTDRGVHRIGARRE